MELTKQQKVTKYLTYIVIIAGASLLQNVSGLFPEIAGARCFLLIPVAVIIAMGEDIFSASLLGLFAGLLWDITSAVHMGFNCIIITLFCFAVSAFVSYIARDTFITNMLCVSLSSAIYCFAYWLCFIVIKGVNAGEITILSFYIPCFIYTVVMTPAIWFVINKIKKKLNHIQKQNF